VEVFMPHRRKIKKGSFAGALDEVVEQFARGRVGVSERPKRDKGREEDRHINDRLFERVWHPRGPSND
jgi:hypothetical protein